MTAFGGTWKGHLPRPSAAFLSLFWILAHIKIPCASIFAYIGNTLGWLLLFGPAFVTLESFFPPLLVFGHSGAMTQFSQANKTQKNNSFPSFNEWQRQHVAASPLFASFSLSFWVFLFYFFLGKCCQTAWRSPLTLSPPCAACCQIPILC